MEIVTGENKINLITTLWTEWRKGLFTYFLSNIGNITAEGNDSGEREAPDGQREENCWKDVFKGKKGWVLLYSSMY